MGLTEEKWAMIQANISRAKLASIGRQIAQDAPQRNVPRDSTSEPCPYCGTLHSALNHCPTPKPSKHRNRKCVVEGISFDSEKEAKRWQDLRLLERVGAIRNLQRQVSFDLYASNGERICVYRADFVYESLELGRLVVEDTKSEWTRRLPVYRIKAKWMAAQGTPVTET